MKINMMTLRHLSFKSKVEQIGIHNNLLHHQLPFCPPTNSSLARTGNIKLALKANNPLCGKKPGATQAGWHVQSADGELIRRATQPRARSDLTERAPWTQSTLIRWAWLEAGRKHWARQRTLWKQILRLIAQALGSHPTKVRNPRIVLKSSHKTNSSVQLPCTIFIG